MKKIVVVAPHPDDETLGCGGVIKKFLNEKNEVYWIIVTKPNKSIKKFNLYINEIKKIQNYFKFTKVFKFNFPSTKLDSIPKAKIIKLFKKTFDKISPNYVFLPYKHDAHSDHQIVNEASTSALKWFRTKSIEKVMIYETLSETNFNFRYKEGNFFKPNLYIDISKTIKNKIDASKLYKSEFKKHPFPRNLKVIKSLATLRGSESGFKYAEAFRLIYERQK
jgi:N-acetylglucosamine malate deacetylase 1